MDFIHLAPSATFLASLKVIRHADGTCSCAAALAAIDDAYRAACSICLYEEAAVIQHSGLLRVFVHAAFSPCVHLHRGPSRVPLYSVTFISSQLEAVTLTSASIHTSSPSANTFDFMC